MPVRNQIDDVLLSHEHKMQRDPLYRAWFLEWTRRYDTAARVMFEPLWRDSIMERRPGERDLA